MKNKTVGILKNDSSRILTNAFYNNQSSNPKIGVTPAEDLCFEESFQDYNKKPVKVLMQKLSTIVNNNQGPKFSKSTDFYQENQTQPNNERSSKN